MIRNVLLCLVLSAGVFTSAAAAEPATMIGFEITFPDGKKWEMFVTDPHWIPLDFPSESAGLFLTANPADHNSVAVVFYSVKYTANDVHELGPQEREQTRTELGRGIMKVGGEPIQSKTLSPFRVRVTKVVHQER